MTKQDYGNGGMVERTPGHWELTVNLGRDPLTGKRRRHRLTLKGNRTTAKRALRDALQQRDTGFAVLPDKLTVGEWLPRWLARHNAEGHISGKTLERYSGIVTKHLIPSLGSLRLQALRPDHINDIKARWLSGKQSTADGPLSGSSVHKHLVVLRQALADATKAGILTRNPADVVTAPSVKVRSERRALTAEEITNLLAAAGGTSYDVPIRFTLATGLREGELLGLRWGDVDLEAGSIQVSRTASYIGGKVVFGAPKSDRSRRTVELSAATVQMLRAHRAAQVEHRLRLGPVWREHGLVFPSPSGTPWLARTFYSGYRKVLTTTTIDNISTVNWHGLRHSAATQWIHHGVDIFSVSRRLGHTSASFTMDVYGHLLKGQQRHAAEALDYLLTKT